MALRILRAARALRFSNRATPCSSSVAREPCRTFSQSTNAKQALRRMRIPYYPQLQRVAPYSSHPQADATPPFAQQPTSTPEKPDYLNELETEIWDRLVAEFKPVELVVQDISGGCGSMYGIEISSDKFRGAGILKQQRMVNKVLADLMKEWHGVQLKTRAP